MQRELLAFSQMRNIGAVRIKALLETVAEPKDIFGLSFKELCRIPSIGVQAAAEIIAFTNWDKVDRILERTYECGYHLISILDSSYPQRLAEIYDAPPLIWAKGDIDILQMPSLAIVGTRKMGSYAKELTSYFTQELIKAGLVIVSGLAIGIDTIAHRSALENHGQTVAILGSGFNRIYPANNIKLAQQIALEGGCLLSEYPPDQVAEAAFFPTRNRLVSGISIGVLIMETELKGGSMITASRALDQNREIFAIPHPINQARGFGGNHLIRESRARLVNSPQEIIEELKLQFKSDEPPCEVNFRSHSFKWRSETEKFSENEKMVLVECEYESMNTDQLLDRLSVDLSELQPILFNLEINQYLKVKPGAKYKTI